MLEVGRERRRLVGEGRRVRRTGREVEEEEGGGKEGGRWVGGGETRRNGKETEKVRGKKG